MTGRIVDVSAWCPSFRAMTAKQRQMIAELVESEERDGNLAGALRFQDALSSRELQRAIHSPFHAKQPPPDNWPFSLALLCLFPYCRRYGVDHLRPGATLQRWPDSEIRGVAKDVAEKAEHLRVAVGKLQRRLVNVNAIGGLEIPLQVSARKAKAVGSAQSGLYRATHPVLDVDSVLAVLAKDARALKGRRYQGLGISRRSDTYESARIVCELRYRWGAIHHRSLSYEALAEILAAITGSSVNVKFVERAIAGARPQDFGRDSLLPVYRDLFSDICAGRLPA